jgi:hypothetical protein
MSFYFTFVKYNFEHSKQCMGRHVLLEGQIGAGQSLTDGCLLPRGKPTQPSLAGRTRGAFAFRRDGKLPHLSLLATGRRRPAKFSQTVSPCS